MLEFRQPLWGYSIQYPDDWIHESHGDTEAFATSPAALDKDRSGPQDGHLLVRGEFNFRGEQVDKLWKDHLVKLALKMGAKDLGSARLSIGGGEGFEAELVLPKKENQRLWTGFLSFGLTVLHLAVAHPLDQRAWFEPVASSIVASLRFGRQTLDLNTMRAGIPLPDSFLPVEPTSLLRDIENQNDWSAYRGPASVGALQAFYLRELPHLGWEFEEFIPYPNQVELGFARFLVKKGEQMLTVAILPASEQSSAIIIKAKQGKSYD